MKKLRNRSDKNITTLSDSLDQQVPRASDSNNIHLSPFEHPEIIFIEPFYGGSHKQLIDTLRNHVPNSHLITLSPKKWPWRARCSALIISSLIPSITTERVLFFSSVLSLAELLGLRPDLHSLKKVVYFHENQLVYPIREIKERDVQFAYNQITTCLSADLIIFNSYYNQGTFLDNIKNVIKMLPDYKPKDLRLKIEHKSRVIYFPVTFSGEGLIASDRVLRIVWPHRWEFDKDPETFVRVLLRLQEEGCEFFVAILGEGFTDVPDVLLEAPETLKNRLIHFGFLPNKEDYFKILQDSHVVVSTAKHEFFGVSMLEACFNGCFPLVPNRLVYPEIYGEKCLYEDEEDLFLRLKEYCERPDLASQHWKEIDWKFEKFSEKKLLADYLEVLKV